MTKTMKAIGYKASLAIENANSLQDITLPIPSASGHDLLVKINAIAVNPVDCKIRQNVASPNDDYKVIGWDAVGEVIALGEAVEHFKVGDTVYYAGDLTRSGSNAEYQLVDERIVGHKPKSLSMAEAAALPLTTITAYELLFDRLGISKQLDSQSEKTPSSEVILVVGAAGGVGSILIQLAKTMTKATIIASASRPDSQEWVKDLGADYVVNHHQPMAAQIKSLNVGPVTHVISLVGTQAYLDDYVELLKPFGKIGLIDDPEHIDIKKLKPKSLSLHWEFMYTRSMFNTEDMIGQQQLLNEVGALLDAGKIKTTIGQNLGPINAKNLRRAHALIESGSAIGKLVLEGF